MGVRACPWPWSATTRGQSGALSGPEGGAQPESGDPAPCLGLWHSRSHRSPAECPQVSRVEEQLEPENRASWTPAGPSRTHRSGPDPWRPERAARAPRLAAWLGCYAGIWMGAGLLIRPSDSLGLGRGDLGDQTFSPQSAGSRAGWWCLGGGARDGPRNLRHQVCPVHSRARAAASFFPEDVKSRVATGTT